MALHNIKITVIDGGKTDTTALGGSENASAETSGEKTATGGQSTLSKVLNYNSTIKSKLKQRTSPTTYFAIQAGVNLATQTGRQIINYYVSDIGRANGDSNYQSVVNRNIEKVTDVLSIGTGALSGAAAGSAFGFVGAASSGISLGFKYLERERSYQHEMFKENTSQAYQLSRANYSALTGRVR